MNQPIVFWVKLIVVLALPQIMFAARATELPNDTVFTYQGELTDNGNLPNGTFAMEFSLWDSMANGTQIGSTLTVPGVLVADGNFSVELEFGAEPYANATELWMEIAIEGVTLSPRQRLTGAPYSLATRGIHVAETGEVGIGTDLPEARLDVDGPIRGRQGLAIGNDAFFGLGSGPYPEFDRIHDLSHHLDDMTSSDAWSPLLSVFTLDPVHDMSSVQLYANSFEVHSAATCDEDMVFVNGLFGAAIHRGTGTVVNSMGGFLHSGTEGTGNITYNSGLLVTAGGGFGGTGSVTENKGVHISTGHWGDAGSILSNYGLFVGSPVGSQTVVDNYGVFIDDQNVGQAANYAIYAAGGNSFLNGDLAITGTLSKGGGSFKIDHPLDPTNKYLYHSFVESPDMMNIYNGNITTDANGYATVELPEWFEALNRDFRYQLTIIDHQDREQFLMAKVVKPIEGNCFRIRTSAGNAMVSWQVTGVRQDAWAEANRIPVEQEKNDHEVGRFLHPQAYGLGPEMSIQTAPTQRSDNAPWSKQR